MSTKENVWADLARPLLRRLDDRWQREDRATARLTLPNMRVFSAIQGGFVERRQHWLTRRWQIRMTVPAYARPKLKLEDPA